MAVNVARSCQCRQLRTQPTRYIGKKLIAIVTIECVQHTVIRTHKNCAFSGLIGREKGAVSGVTDTRAGFSRKNNTGVDDVSHQLGACSERRALFTAVPTQVIKSIFPQVVCRCRRVELIQRGLQRALNRRPCEIGCNRVCGCSRIAHNDIARCRPIAQHCGSGPPEGIFNRDDIAATDAYGNGHQVTGPISGVKCALVNGISYLGQIL